MSSDQHRTAQPAPEARKPEIITADDESDQAEHRDLVVVLLDDQPVAIERVYFIDYLLALAKRGDQQ